jgi:hypothetical protein
MKMTVRAKFYVSEKKTTAQNVGLPTGDFIILSPVVSGSDENKSFYKWTPSGKIELGIVNPEAAAQFIVGSEYYIDFTKVE